MRGDLTVVALDVVGGEPPAQVLLSTSGPTRVFGDRTVGQAYGVAIVVRGGIAMVVAVLVVQAEQVSALVRGVGERAQPLPSAGFGAGRQVVGVLVVVSGLSPAVEVHVQPADAGLAQRAQLVGAPAEGDERVVALRMLRIVHGRIGLDVRFGADVHPHAAGQLPYGGVAHGLFGERAQQAVFVGPGAIGFGHAGDGGELAGEQPVADRAAIIHAPQAGFEPGADVRVGAVRRMVDDVSGVGGRLADGHVSRRVGVPEVADLGVERHVAAFGPVAPVERDGGRGRGPVVGDHGALAVGDERDPVAVRLVECERRGPGDAGHVQCGVVQRHPFGDDIAGGRFDPYVGFEGVVGAGESLVADRHRLSRAGGAALGGDVFGLAEGDGDHLARDPQCRLRRLGCPPTVSVADDGHPCGRLVEFDESAGAVACDHTGSFP